MTSQQRYVGVNVTKALVPGCCPILLVTVIVVLLVMVVLVDCDTASAHEYSTVALTLASSMKSIPASTERLTPTVLVIVVSVLVVKDVLTVTPCEIENEQVPPEHC